MTLLHTHHHDHSHSDDQDDHSQVTPIKAPVHRAAVPFLMAALVLGAAIAVACLVMVEAGDAVVITRFGDPVRVITRAGLTWRIPPPIEDTVKVDLRLRTTSSGLQDVGTRDGLRVLVQAYIAWQVPDDPAHITQFLRAVRNDPDAAAQQLRTLLGSALEATAVISICSIWSTLIRNRSHLISSNSNCMTGSARTFSGSTASAFARSGSSA